MNYPAPQRLDHIASLIDAEFVGPADFEILGQNEIHVVRPGDIVFVDHPKYYHKALDSAATIILINQKVECPAGKALLVHDDPFGAFNKLTRHFRPFVYSNTMIDPSAEIGEGTKIQPGAFVGPNVKIGKNCLIHANATINHDCEIGDYVEIHSNVVVGSDAHYYQKKNDQYRTLQSGGKVIIENHATLGAGTTIDRGVSGETIIGWGTKLDNLCHIAHDTRIGKNCLFAAHTGVAGCTVVEDNVVMWGRVGITSGITIGENAVILACSCVSKSLEGNKTYFGSPAIEAREAWKQLALIRKLPEIMVRLKA
ncbi:MAG TPA: UDP-3-O-(3-hydroxymyristoyl)glucosamine N-acyltransferase [Flavobacteriales bacterium]|jgi:UDP-3-O-[3-hydroxymyristoyl] glucosamine N-acyltransferase|nr:UDP-3-O-(3-hydroxymyristoyl)glucosamine N-acyltransferase [Flavobacteriales bacterium]